MGNLLSRGQNGRIEEVDANTSNLYTFPSKNGCYFASHFIMGGERFETSQPEAYLFGENMDLNFLGGRPTPFPYSAPLPHEPTRTLRALINIRKESLRFVKIQTPTETTSETTENGTAEDKTQVKPLTQYNIEFAFDTDVRCSIAIYYFCSEEVTSNGIVYTPRDVSMNSEVYVYKRGANQQFSQSSHVFDPSLYNEDELSYRAIDEHGYFDASTPLPIVIQCVAQEGEEPRQSHSLIAVIEKNHDNTYSIKPLKQKIFVDGLYYLLQEIYGIENKNIGNKQDSGTEEIEDNSSECVICMSDSRDTLILPCRHLCLCNGCADSLRYQANNCPICRAPFRALLQIKAVKKQTSNALLNSTPPTIPHHHQLMASNSASDLIDVPPGYEPISLIEALNGPSQSHLPKRTSLGENVETPTNLRKFHKNERSKKLPLMDTNASGTTNTPTRSRKALASPTTPEVVVSALPLSPDKEAAINLEAGNNNVVYDTKDRDRDIRWRIRNTSKTHKTGDDNGSNSSSSSNSTSENISMQERVRLLGHDKDDEIEYINDDHNVLTEERTKFKKPAISPPMVKDSPENSSPLSIGVSSGSYAMISLGDGLDEQRVMDSDLLSIATSSSATALGLRQEEDYESDYGNPEELPQDGRVNDSVTTLLTDKISRLEESGKSELGTSERQSKDRSKTRVQQLDQTRITLAETENTDDEDLSPTEV